MQPGGRLPIYLDTAVGYAMWWIEHPGRGPNAPADILQRLLAVQGVPDMATARRVLRQAQTNLTATGRIRVSTGNVSLRAGCGYRCPRDTPIALRIRMNVTGPGGVVVADRSIVIQARAYERLQDVLERARNVFNARFAHAASFGPGMLRMDNTPTPANIDQVLLNYTQGTP